MLLYTYKYYQYKNKWNNQGFLGDLMVGSVLPGGRDYQCVIVAPPDRIFRRINHWWT